MPQKRYETLADAALMQEFQASKANHEPIFNEIYRRYGQRIKVYAVRVLGSEDDGSDVFQETFVRFYHVALRERQIENIGGYLMRIARNNCLNHKRNTKSTVTIDDFEIAVPHVPHYEREELLNLIALALEYLDFDYREAFVLRFYQDCSYEEIAQLTGASVTTVTNRIWRAKDKLKTILAPYLAEIAELNG